MAVICSLNSVGLRTFDLTDLTSSLFLQESAYVPVVVTPTGDGSIPAYVVETLPVGLNATAYDDYATQMQDLAALQKRAAEYWINQQQAVPVWFNCKLDGETGERRALVKSIDFSFDPRNWQQWLYQECTGTVPPKYLFGTLLIERHPYWERTSARTFPNATPAAAAAVAYDYTATADVVGDVPARVNALAIRSSESGANAITRLWMGVRSATLHGATGITAFIPIWELEDGTAQNGDVTKDSAGGATEGNTASPGGGGGDCFIIHENVEDWDAAYVAAVYISASDVGYTTMSDGAGRFLWLLRARVTAGEWSVYMRNGYVTARNYHEPVSITNMSYDYHELGVNTVPPYDAQGVTIAGVLHDHWIFLYAKRLSGAGDLYLDCLCPIPIDEGFAKVFDGGAATTQDVLIGEGPHEHTQVLTVVDDAGGDYALDIDAYEFENFRLPPGDGRIVCAYARSIRSELPDQVEFADAGVTASIYTERWTALRGAE